MFRINLFGVPGIVGPDGPVGGKASQRHRIALVALVAGAGEKGIARERLAHFLWPDAESTKAARRLLSDSIYRVNQAVGGEALVAVNEALHLDGTRLESDLAEFSHAIEHGQWQRAVELQSAPFLDGFALPSAPFEQWMEQERRRLGRQLQEALESLARNAATDDPRAATAWWRELAAQDPFSSRIALELMRALVAQGDRSAAVQHAARHAKTVRAELGLEPDPQVILLAESLRQGGGTRDQPPQVEASEASSSGLEREDRPRPQKPLPSPPNAVKRRPTWVGPAAIAVALAVLSLVFVRTRMTRVSVPAVERSSIAVLPFVDNSADNSSEYFADGMTDELISRLSAVDGLRVVARTSSFAFKGRSLDVREIGRQLNVGAVLEGAVLRTGERLQVSVQLVDATDGFELWAETYEREFVDVLAVQQEIAREIVARMTREAAGTTQVAAPSTDDAEAFNLYLRGRFEWHKRSAEGLHQSVELLERAVERAPTFARAHAGLADAYAVLGFYDYLSPDDAFPKAIAGAERAVALDPTMAEPFATLGYAALYYAWDPIEAERRFRQSVVLNPGYSTGHQWYANLLLASARFAEAEAEMRIAQELDPLSRIASGALGYIHYLAREPERARRQLDRTLQLDPAFEVAHLWMGMTHELEGRLEDALRSYERAVALSGSAIARAALARGLALAGRTGEAQEVLAELEAEAMRTYIPSYEIAKIHLALGDPPSALARLGQALRERSHSMVFVAIDPQLDDLRDDPAFNGIVDQVPVARMARERGR